MKKVAVLICAFVCVFAQEAGAATKKKKQPLLYPDCVVNQRATEICECHYFLGYQICAPGQFCTDKGQCIGARGTRKRAR
jgi:hypothetical protein